MHLPCDLLERHRWSQVQRQHRWAQAEDLDSASFEDDAAACDVEAPRAWEVAWLCVSGKA